jgi:virulence-associated protein VagC
MRVNLSTRSSINRSGIFLFTWVITINVAIDNLIFPSTVMIYNRLSIAIVFGLVVVFISNPAQAAMVIKRLPVAIAPQLVSQQIRFNPINSTRIIAPLNRPRPDFFEQGKQQFEREIYNITQPSKSQPALKLNLPNPMINQDSQRHFKSHRRDD